MVTTTLAKKPLEAQFVNAFLNTTISVIKTLGSCNLVFEGACIEFKYHNNRLLTSVVECYSPTGELSHLVGLMFPEEAFDILIKQMKHAKKLDYNITEKMDVLGEFTNIISGDAQTKLVANDMPSYYFSPPRCVYNPNVVQAAFGKKRVRFFLHFRIENQPFYIQIGIS